MKTLTKKEGHGGHARVIFIAKNCAKEMNSLREELGTGRQRRHGKHIKHHRMLIKCRAKLLWIVVEWACVVCTCSRGSVMFCVTIYLSTDGSIYDDLPIDPSINPSKHECVTVRFVGDFCVLCGLCT